MLWPDEFTLMVMLLPLVVALTQLAVGEPAVIGGLVLEPVLSLPTTVTVWLVVADPVAVEKVEDAGIASNTGLFDCVTRTETDTVVTPLGVVMLTVAWYGVLEGPRLVTPLKRSTSRVAGVFPKVPELPESKFNQLAPVA